MSGVMAMDVRAPWEWIAAAYSQSFRKRKRRAGFHRRAFLLLLAAAD
jgi:hypothetical protein